VLDSHYQETRVISATRGYHADAHELQILPNGHALFLIYDPQPASSEAISAGVPATATVIGLVIQELDTSGLETFHWESWDHFLITDTYVALNAPMVDYVHGNALEVANDGNLLLSSRHLSEITKIDHIDGHIIWRLGGKNNQFNFVNDPDGPFY